MSRWKEMESNQELTGKKGVIYFFLEWHNNFILLDMDDESSGRWHKIYSRALQFSIVKI